MFLFVRILRSLFIIRFKKNPSKLWFIKFKKTKKTRSSSIFFDHLQPKRAFVSSFIWNKGFTHSHSLTQMTTVGCRRARLAASKSVSKAFTSDRQERLTCRPRGGRKKQIRSMRWAFNLNSLARKRSWPFIYICQTFKRGPYRNLDEVPLLQQIPAVFSSRHVRDDIQLLPDRDTAMLNIHVALVRTLWAITLKERAAMHQRGRDRLTPVLRGQEPSGFCFSHFFNHPVQGGQTTCFSAIKDFIMRK